MATALSLVSFPKATAFAAVLPFVLSGTALLLGSHLWLARFRLAI
jgi:hypothetical protein